MRKVLEGLFIVPAAVLFTLFFVIPLVMLALVSVRGAAGGLTLVNYTQIITNPYYARSLFNSLWLSLAVTAATLVIAGVIAFFLARTEFRGKSLYMTLITFPVSLPGVVVGFMIIILFGSTGVIPMMTSQLWGKSLGAIAYTIPGIFFAYLYFNIPRIVMTLYGAIVEFDVRLEEAARTVGANERQAMFLVVLPTLAPVFVSAAALSFYTTMSAFGTAFTLANQFEIIPIVMYNEFTLNFRIAEASAMAIIIGVICVVLNMVYRSIMEKS
jgi:putative spermidine/putrescine transport system permease protein